MNAYMQYLIVIIGKALYTLMTSEMCLSGVFQQFVVWNKWKKVGAVNSNMETNDK